MLKEIVNGTFILAPFFSGKTWWSRHSGLVDGDRYVSKEIEKVVPGWRKGDSAKVKEFDTALGDKILACIGDFNQKNVMSTFIPKVLPKLTAIVIPLIERHKRLFIMRSSKLDPLKTDWEDTMAKRRELMDLAKDKALPVYENFDFTVTPRKPYNPERPDLDEVLLQGKEDVRMPTVNKGLLVEQIREVDKILRTRKALPLKEETIKKALEPEGKENTEEKEKKNVVKDEILKLDIDDEELKKYLRNRK